MNRPSFYQPSKVGTLYQPDTPTVTIAAQAARASLRRDRNQPRVMLLLVDPQVDFVHTDGALAVPGAVEDTQRIIEWILDNVGQISHIAASLDTHLIYQIMTIHWWVNQAGEHPDPFTSITLADYRDKTWRPLQKMYNYADPTDPKSAKLPWGQDDTGTDIYDWNEWYLYCLDQQAKKPLVTWPDHTMLGTPGHAIVPSLFEAIIYHSLLVGNQPQFLTKGSLFKTENYSIMEPEVKVASEALGGLNTAFLDMLANYDLIYIAGQASSHCVYETIVSIVNYFGAKAPEVLKRIRILSDCTSPVQGFEKFAQDAMARFKTDNGLKLVTSTDPIG